MTTTQRDAGLAAITAKFRAGIGMETSGAAAEHAARHPDDPVAALIAGLEANTRAMTKHDALLLRKACAAYPVPIPPVPYLVSGGALVPGQGYGGSVSGPGTGYFWDVTRVTVEGLSASGALPSGTSSEGSVTTPAAGATIATITPAAGTYMIDWQVSLAGTPAAGDANNFALRAFAANLEVSDNPGAVGGPWPQEPRQLTVNGAQAVSIVAVAAGTAGAIYTAQLSAVPVAGTPVTGDAVRLYKRFGSIKTEGLHTFTAAGTAPGPDWRSSGSCFMRDGDFLQLVAVSSLTSTEVVLSGEAINIEAGWIGDYFL